MMSTTVKTTCPYCGTGCGIIATTDPEGRVSIQGDPDHPANRGRLCSKGAALGETLGLEERLLRPRIGDRDVGWDEALDQVANRFREMIDRHGPDAVAFYVSGQLLTEDYYVANKLMKGFIGSANIDTNSRLCMSSSVAGHKHAFGSDTVPGCYDDLEEADLIVLTGSNTAWCHPVIYQRIAAAKRARPELRVVVIDPRRTQTCAIADLHLPLAPGSDTLLFSGLLAHLERSGAIDAAFVADHTTGADAALENARFYTPTPLAVAEQCGLDADDVATFFRWYATIERTVTVYSQGVNQSSAGTDKVNAILNCHLLTGRIGRPGMGPLSLTGQPNAMGGREVGGLANQLAAHMELDDPRQRALVARFWNTSNLASRPGLKAVDLFRALESGRVRALWVVGTNPAVSLPDAARVRAALARCEFLVVSDCSATTDTGRFADVLLPALAWGEKEGTVTNSERCISRQRAFLPPPGETRPDWWIFAEVARRMGFGHGFGYPDAAAIFREYATLTGFENHGTRDLDLSGLADRDYDAIGPLQWPVAAATGTARLFADGRFFTTDGRARLVPITPRPPAHATGPDYPLVLNSGRVRDQWHTMTRTGLSPRLSSHIAEPYVEIHPDDAAVFGVADGGLARVATAWGEALLRVRLSPDQRRGTLFAPMHWSDRFARQGRVNPLVNPAVDPYSGQPEFKHTPARIVAWRPAWHGLLLSREPLELGGFDYAARARGNGHWRHEIAGTDAGSDWPAVARRLLRGEAWDWLEFGDPARGLYRAARLEAGRLLGCLFVGPEPISVGREWLEGLFQRPGLCSRSRRALLAGRPPSDQPDAGRIVCACFQVGEQPIIEAINAGASDVEQIGARLHAGSNCGSCVPELAALLRAARGAA